MLRLLHARFQALPIITVAALASTAVLPALDQDARETGLLALGLVVVAAAAWVVARAGRPARPTAGVRSTVRPTLELLLHLSPVALLTLVFPIASGRIAQTQVGGTDLTTLLLASSLTVPWLSQAVCLPVYRALGALISAGDQAAIERRFCQVWPAAFLQSAPVVLIFAVPVQLAMGWSPTALGAYLALCLLHMAFAQSLVPGNVGRRRVLWASAWAGYALVLFVVPTGWFLPPLVGLATQLVPLRRSLGLVRTPAWLDGRDIALDVTRGVLLGAVLWSDKLFYFLRADGRFEVNAIFLALLPAVLAYNYYFVRLAPAFDRSVEGLRQAMEHEPYHVLADRSVRLSSTVETSISRTAVIGACLGFVITFVVSGATPYSTALVAAVAVASWLFMMTTVLCYKLDYVGKSTLAQGYSALHLVVCAAAFLTMTPGPLLYAWLIGFELVLFGLALRSCLDHWRSAEYTLFWRHATAW